MTRPNHRLKELRAAAALSQQDLADLVNAAAANDGKTSSVTAGQVSRWERGQNQPQPFYRRKLAEVLGVPTTELDITPPAPAANRPDYWGDYVPEPEDERVQRSQQEWRARRQLLNGHRHALAQVAADVYDPAVRLGATGLIAHPDWIPDYPVAITDVDLSHDPNAADAELDGTEREADYVKPMQSLGHPYAHYTTAIRDLARPRLFENRLCWRLTDVEWGDGKGRMGFADTSYFAATDVAEVASHELAYVALGDHGQVRTHPSLRDLPYRRLIGDPFDTARRPNIFAISTLTIRKGDDLSFILHRRDPRSVTIAGGMLQVIPSGIFQPSSPMPAAREADFSLWRNIEREYAEELLGLDEAGGDGNPVRYGRQPFLGLDAAARDGQFRVSCLGVALDALSLVGEILTVAVIDAEVFDDLARDFVETNEEGSVVGQRVPFTDDGVRGVLDSGRMAPAGAGCLTLAWRWREQLGLGG